MTILTKTLSVLNASLRPQFMFIQHVRPHTLIQRHLVTSQSLSRIKKSESELQWLFPASKEMVSMAEGHKYGYLVSLCVGTYNSVKPITPEHVKQTLNHIERLFPNHVCTLKMKGDQLWACKDPNQKIDLKVFEGTTAEDVANDLTNTPLNYEKGPISQFCLIPLPDDSPCRIPELKSAFPYQCEIIYFTHHSLYDGIGGAFTLGGIRKVLNDVLAGRPVDDSKPQGIFVADEDIIEEDRKLMEKLKMDPEQLEAKKQELLACESPPIILKAFPPPGGIPVTKHAVHHISPQNFANFFANCKKAGVTFNDGFEALINTALVEMVRDAGVKEESHQISVHLVMNLRKFKKRYDVPQLGFHTRPIVHRTETKTNNRDHFWQYTQKLHSKLLNYINSGEALLQSVVRQMTMPQVSPVEHFKGTPKLIRDYGLTNIGEVSKLIGTDGDHMQISNFTVYTGVQKCPFMMLHTVFTYKGQPTYTISYDTSYMTNDVAHELQERVANLFNHFSQ